ncbi:hypothetical protein GCM10009593_29290 [Microlunatus antarcticus]
MSPASTRPLPFASTGVPAILSSDSWRSELVGVDVDDAFDVTVTPPGAVPVAVAVLLTTRASESTWVITYGAFVVQVVLAPGASVVVGQVVGPTLPSTIRRPVRVCAPVFVTANEYAIVSPAAT